MPPPHSANNHPGPITHVLPYLGYLIQLCRKHLQTNNPAEKSFIKTSLITLVEFGLLDSLVSNCCHPQATTTQLSAAATFITLFKYAQVRIDRTLEHIIMTHPDWRTLSLSHGAMDQIINPLNAFFENLHLPYKIYTEENAQQSIHQLGSLLTITINNRISLLFNIENDNQYNFDLRKHVLLMNDNIISLGATPTNQAQLATFIQFKCILVMLAEMYNETCIDLMKLSFEEFCELNERSPVIYTTLVYYTGIKTFMDAVQRLLMQNNPHAFLAPQYQQLTLAYYNMKSIIDANACTAATLHQYLAPLNTFYATALSAYGKIMDFQNQLLFGPTQYPFYSDPRRVTPQAGRANGPMIPTLTYK